jgi:hypothetical protein
MKYEIVPLQFDHLDVLLGSMDPSLFDELRQSYFSQGSSAECLLADGVPVFAGGIVNAKWKRGVAWMIPTPFFRSHLLTCMRAMKKRFPMMARGFVRVQAECVQGVSASIIFRLGFKYEGTMQKFGPNGESCRIFARIFEEAS